MPPFRRLVIESTGLADPFPILSTVQADPVLRHHFRLGNVITTVDAVNGMRSSTRSPRASSRSRSPTGWSSPRPILRRRDRRLARRAACAASTRRRRSGAAPNSTPTRERYSRRTLSPASGTERWWLRACRPLATAIAHGGRNRHDDIRAVALSFDEPLDWTMFGIWLTMLLHRHGNEVLRVKGILNVASADAPVAIHGVQHLVHPPTHMTAWPDADRRSRLVFIVKGLVAGGDRAVFASLQHDVDLVVFAPRACALGGMHFETAGLHLKRRLGLSPVRGPPHKKA